MPQAISAGHQETLNAAKLILQDGGNAFDAAVAAYFSMFINEPCMASAGAGGFALCHHHRSGTQMLDFFSQTPRNKIIVGSRDFEPIVVDFGNETEHFHVGLASAAVPGAIAGIFEIHRKYGSLPIRVLLQPALSLADSGVPLETFQSMTIVLLESIFRKDPSIKDVFFKEGNLLMKGDILKLPNFKGFLEFLIDEGARGFYQGEIAHQIAKDSLERGGYLRRDDFELYQTHWRKPILVDLFDHTVALPNGPSIGGAIMAILFAYQKEFKGNWIKSIEKVISRKFLASDIHYVFNQLYPEKQFDLQGSSISSRGTSHFNIIDKWGNSIALTTSIGEGCGYFIPGTDMHLNNMMGESVLLPEGFHTWKPNTRLHSMMTPTMVLNKAGELRFSGGSGGAGRIPFMIAQVIENVFHKHMDLEDATIAPRTHIHGGKLHFESGAIIDENNGYETQEWNYQSLFFGGVHSVSTKKGKNGPVLQAAGDSRRYGVGEVF